MLGMNRSGIVIVTLVGKISHLIRNLSWHYLHSLSLRTNLLLMPMEVTLELTHRLPLAYIRHKLVRKRSESANFI